MKYIAEIVAEDLFEGELREGLPYEDILDVVTRAFEALPDHGWIMLLEST